MARARTVKPSYFDNEQLAKCDPLSRLLFIGLWCHADKEGKIEDRPERIRARILPFDNCDVDKLLDQLYHSGFVLRYTVGTIRVIQVVSWKKHAKCHPDETSSGLPDPPEGTTKEQKDLIVPLALTLNSNLNPPNPPSGGTTDRLEKPRKSRTKTQDIPAPGFDAFWDIYPRKDAKIRAAVAWNKLSPDEVLQQTILADVDRQKRTNRRWIKDDGEFIPLPATYLNGRYWEDQGVKLPKPPPADTAKELAEAARRTAALRDQEAREKAQAGPPPEEYFRRKAAQQEQTDGT